ncbi:MAG: hypothetical protein V3T40_06960 [Nitrososphaerales archaeon]
MPLLVDMDWSVPAGFIIRRAHDDTKRPIPTRGKPMNSCNGLCKKGKGTAQCKSRPTIKGTA